MFPFRIFNPQIINQSNPGWSDDYGAANWRTFSVWTGMAPAYLLQTAGSGAPSGAYVGLPQLVYVARTTGYNLAGIMASNTAELLNIAGATNSQTVANAQIIGENYNEYYAAQMLGAYPPNANNGPNGTGPQKYNEPFNEVCFTAPPSSLCVFWVSWDINTSTPVNNYTLALNGEFYASFPVLHFGGITANSDYISANSTPYFGDLNNTNGPLIMGSLPNVGLFDQGAPPQIYPPFPANAFAAPLNGGSQTPEGTALIGMIVVGASGAASDTGNDGIAQILQAQFNNFSQVYRTQYRGAYNASNWYFPNDMALENGTTYIQGTSLSLLNIDPSNGVDSTNLANGANYASYKNLWIALGGGSGTSVYTMNIVAEQSNYVQCKYAINGANANVAKPIPLRGFVNNTTDSQGFNVSIQPPYSNTGNNSTLYAYSPSGGTNVSGVVLLDSNEIPRQQMKQFTTCENISGVPTTKSRWFACSNYF